MKNYKSYFKNKKITMMGLGLLGRGIAVAEFLAKQGAWLTITDLKTEKELASSIKKLTPYATSIRYVLGRHDMADFKNVDMVIKSAGVSLDSMYIREARKHKIPVEMDASLFAKLSSGVTIVGVTGTRGKTMTTVAIYTILKKEEKFLKRNIYIAGNIRKGATLPLLEKTKKGDIVVLELDSWQMQGFGDSKISPQVAVFTSFMPDHLNYYKGDLKQYFADKASIFKYQKSGDSLFVRPGMIEFLPKKVPGVLNVVDPRIIDGWDIKTPGEHQQENLACAVEVGELFGIPLEKIRKTLENFQGVEGRLQYLAEVKGVKVYNDNNSTTPDATIAGLQALSTKEKNIVLIMGGADKKLNMKPLLKIIPKHCKHVVYLPGTGTDAIGKKGTKNLDQAVKEAFKFAKRGDTILFSPAFASFGLFVNEYDRNDQFVKIIKKMK